LEYPSISEFVREVFGDIRLDVIRHKGKLKVLGKNEAMKILLDKEKQ